MNDSLPLMAWLIDSFLVGDKVRTQERASASCRAESPSAQGSQTDQKEPGLQQWPSLPPPFIIA